MNYLLEAAQHLGIYYTPASVLALGYGDGKTEAYASNPPFTAGYKRVRRIVLIDCPQCSGRGFVATKHGYVRCTAPGCVNGDVERILVEVVSAE